MFKLISFISKLKVHHFLFGGQADLVAFNIQRGRDHGLPGYVKYREMCLVGKATSFDDLENNISKEVYKLENTHKMTIMPIFFLPNLTI